ncbi:hypothetical protein EF908_28030, partial [Streptomyces sp. WAC04770]
RRARERVQEAKVALGERGTPWWEQSPAERARRWRDGLARRTGRTTPAIRCVGRNTLDLP